MRPLVLVLTYLLLAPAAASAESKPVALPFEDAFEGRARQGLTDGWRHGSQKRSAAVTDQRSLRGERSLGVSGQKSWMNCAHVLLPKLPDQLTYRVSVFPPGNSKRAVRVGFLESSGKAARFYNFINLRSEGGTTGLVFFKRGLNARPVQVGKYRAGRWLTVGVHLDFEKRLARVWLNDEEVAKDIPILPREFDDPRHGRVVLRNWAVGHRFWRPGPADRAYFDDVRIAVWTGQPPTGKKARAEEADRLLELLGHEEWEERRRAAEGLAKLGDRRAVPPLMSAVKEDESWLVRVAAAMALGRLRDERAAEPLLAALEDESYLVRKAAVSALAALGGPKAVDRLMTALRNDIKNVRFAASQRLASLGAPAVGPLLEALTERHEVSRSAGDALKKIGAGAVESVITVLAGDHVGARIIAVEVLSEIGDKRAVDPLVETLRKDPSERVRGDAARAVAPLLKMAGGKNAFLRSGAVHALERIEGDAAHGALVGLLSSEDAKTRADAAGSLGGRKDRRAVPPLVALLRDGDARPRLTASVALGRLGWKPPTEVDRAWFLAARREWTKAAAFGGAAVEPLVLAVQDRDASVRRGAAEVLPGLGPAAIEPLRRIADHPDSAVRHLVAEALRKLGYAPVDAAERARLLVRSRKWEEAVKLGAAAIEPLVEALADRDVKARRKASDCLARLGWKPGSDAERALDLVARKEWDEAVKLGPAAFAPLLNALRSRESGRVQAARCNAAEALGRLGDGRAVEPLIEALTTGGDEVRGVAAEALGRLGDPRAVEPLAAVLAERMSFAQPRIAAALALGRIGSEKAEKILRAALDGGDFSKKLEAAAKAGERKAVPWLVHDRIVRCAAAAGLHELGDAKALEYVIDRLSDSYGRVRGEAALMLAEIDPPPARAVAAIERALSDPANRRIREPMAHALKRLKEKLRESEKDDFTASLTDGRGQTFLAIRKGRVWSYEVRKRSEVTTGRIEVVGVFEDGTVRAKLHGLGDEDMGPTVFWRTSGGFLVWEWIAGVKLKVLKSGAAKGEKWESDAEAIGPGGRLVSKVAAVESVRTPAGTFPDCLRIEHRPSVVVEGKRRLEDFVIATWWAKGVGLVRLENRRGEEVRESWKLTAHEAGGASEKRKDD